jgi:hypothetical protein
MHLFKEKPQLMVNPKKRVSVSLFEWIKQDPKDHLIDLYKNKCPQILIKRADRFCQWFTTYPGDGVLFFMDSLLTPLVKIKSDYFKELKDYHYTRIEAASYPLEFKKIFNYLYSFQKDFTSVTKSVLALLLLMNPYLAIPLYKYRKYFDPEKWTNLINKMRPYKSISAYLARDPERFLTQFIWQSILGCQIPISICDLSMFLHLYYGYTYQALQRFSLLAKDNLKTEFKQHINLAYDVYKQTYLLLGAWQNDPSRLDNINRPFPQMSSIKAMQRFHDLKTEELLNEQMLLETGRHTWEFLTLIIQEISPEWYIPEFATDIRLRGQKHHNCVGAYVNRHLEYVNNHNTKTLLIFTDYYEAELSCTFDKLKDNKTGKEYIGCISCKVQQARMEFNKEIPPRHNAEIGKITESFEELPLEYFNPKVIPFKYENKCKHVMPGEQ